MPHAARDGLRLYYEHAGSGEPAFLFVHGWCCDRTFFEPQFEHFKASHAVTAVDLRGCGKSDVPPDGYDIPTLADDVAWLCTEIEISRPIVVGHSLGGMIGIDLAARHPSVPLAVVAVDPGPIDPLPEARALFADLLDALRGPEAAAQRRAYVDEMFLPHDDLERASRIADTMCAVPLEVATAVIEGVVAWNGADALRRCNVPLLVIRSLPGGSNDAARLLPLKPDLHYGVTVGAGHFHQLDVPEQVTPMIERFVRIAVAEGAQPAGVGG